MATYANPLGEPENGIAQRRRRHQHHAPDLAGRRIYHSDGLFELTPRPAKVVRE
jgi:hypothetical protein